MDRINTINAREDMFGVGKSGFHDNADLPGQDATYVSPKWCNTIQEEICNILELNDIELDPESHSQLYDLLFRAASTSQKGMVQLASATEIQEGLNNTKAITPSVLLSLFSSLVNASSGRLTIPNGTDPNKPFLLQWGSGTVINGGAGVTFPVAFPNACLKAFVCEGVGGFWLPSWFTLYSVAGSTKTTLDVRGVVYNNGSFSSGNQVVFNYFAIGN